MATAPRCETGGNGIDKHVARARWRGVAARRPGRRHTLHARVPRVPLEIAEEVDAFGDAILQHVLVGPVVHGQGALDGLRGVGKVLGGEAVQVCVRWHVHARLRPPHDTRSREYRR